jgi:hypothetical protein
MMPGTINICIVEMPLFFKNTNSLHQFSTSDGLTFMDEAIISRSWLCRKIWHSPQEDYIYLWITFSPHTILLNLFCIHSPVTT